MVNKSGPKAAALKKGGVGKRGERGGKEGGQNMELSLYWKSSYHMKKSFCIWAGEPKAWQKKI